jgi:hypothetical protein
MIIRRNEQSDLPEDNQDDLQSMRDFSRIRRAANHLWQEFLPKPENHTARGLVFTASGAAITADLSFEKPKKCVLLMIRLRINDKLTPSQARSIAKVQNETIGLSCIAYDEDGHILKIRSQSVLPAAVMAQAVVPQVIKDAVALLEHDNLKDIVEHSVSY